MAKLKCEFCGGEYEPSPSGRHGCCGCRPAGALTGRVVASFRIEAELGRGANAVVYRATQLSLDRPVALKILSAKLARNPEYIRQFLRESHLAAQLNSPFIVQAIDAGESGGLYYFAMELVTGETADDFLTRHHGPVPHDLALRWAISVAEALEYAYQRCRLVHGDLKPGNILIRRSDQAAKLADLGLARAADETDSGEIMATPAYAAPELILRRVTGANLKSDLYSFGVTLYELFSGRLPFRGTPREILDAHLQKTAEPLDRRFLGFPPALARLIEELMAKGPEQRPADWSAVVRRLRKIARGEGVKPPPKNAAPPRSRYRLRRRLLSLALLLTLLAAVVIVGNAACERLGLNVEWLVQRWQRLFPKPELPRPAPELQQQLPTEPPIRYQPGNGWAQQRAGYERNLENYRRREQRRRYLEMLAVFRNPASEISGVRLQQLMTRFGMSREEFPELVLIGGLLPERRVPRTVASYVLQNRLEELTRLRPVVTLDGESARLLRRDETGLIFECPDGSGRIRRLGLAEIPETLWDELLQRQVQGNPLVFPAEACRYICLYALQHGTPELGRRLIERLVAAADREAVLRVWGELFQATPVPASASALLAESLAGAPERVLPELTAALAEGRLDAAGAAEVLQRLKRSPALAAALTAGRSAAPPELTSAEALLLAAAQLPLTSEQGAALFKRCAPGLSRPEQLALKQRLESWTAQAGGGR